MMPLAIAQIFVQKTLHAMLQPGQPVGVQREAYYKLYELVLQLPLGDWLQLVHQNPDVIREANRIAVEFCIGKEPFNIKAPNNNQPITEEVKVSKGEVKESTARKAQRAIDGLYALIELLNDLTKANIEIIPVDAEVTVVAGGKKGEGKLVAEKLAAAQPSPEPEVKVETAAAPVVEVKSAPVAEAAPKTPAPVTMTPITKEMISQKIMGTFPGMKKSLPREKIFEILAKVGGAGCTKLGAIPEAKYGELNSELDSAIAAL